MRWFGAAAALAALSADTDSLQGADLQLTTAVVLNAQEKLGPLNLIALHLLHELAHVEIEASRLGFTETVWAGSERETRVPAHSDAIAKWRGIPDAARK